jgi:hypothetical protein
MSVVKFEYNGEKFVKSTVKSNLKSSQAKKLASDLNNTMSEADHEKLVSYVAI